MADAVFNCCPGGTAPDWSRLKSLHVGGCKMERMASGDEHVVGGVQDADCPEFWTVYGRDHDGYLEAITDIASRSDVQRIALELAVVSGIPIEPSPLVEQEAR